VRSGCACWLRSSVQIAIVSAVLPLRPSPSAQLAAQWFRVLWDNTRCDTALAGAQTAVTGQVVRLRAIVTFGLGLGR
jgi:hypothetical protein